MTSSSCSFRHKGTRGGILLCLYAILLFVPGLALAQDLAPPPPPPPVVCATPPDMEIDGDAVDDPGKPGLDWDSVLGYNGFPGITSGDTVSTGLIRDDLVPDPSSFTQGSKDFEPINQWVCTEGQVKDKNDMQNGAAIYFPGSNIFYFMLDRLGVEGDAYIGFWLFGASVYCDSPGTHNFVGNHVTGDLLVQIDFTGGGSTGNVRLFLYRRPPGLRGREPDRDPGPVGCRAEELHRHLPLRHRHVLRDQHEPPGRHRRSVLRRLRGPGRSGDPALLQHLHG
jgi:hypothetical protein